MLQTTFPAQPGLLLVVDRYVTLSGDPGTWHVKLWDWRTPHQEFPDDFALGDEARAWAEREFLVDPAAWEECADAGSPESVADIVRRLYQRPLTCEEAAAFALLADAYEFLDARGRPIWPGRERCIVSFGVVADALDSLEWKRGDCRFFHTNAANTYGFVADSNHHSNAGVIESSAEFRAMWAAFVAAAGVAHWGPVDARPLPRAMAEPGDGPLASAVREVLARRGTGHYETGALARALELTDGSGVLRIDARYHVALNEMLSDVRTLEVIGNSAEVEVLLRRRLPDGSSMIYRTAADGILRKAVRRGHDHGALVEVSLDDERARFEEEVEAWQSEGFAEEEPRAAHFVEPDDELRILRERMAAGDADALTDALSFLSARGVFVAEAMNQAPPHVVRRVVLEVLQHVSAAGDAESVKRSS